MMRNNNNYSRREVLGASGTILATALAGCSEDKEDSANTNDTDTGFTPEKTPIETSTPEPSPFDQRQDESGFDRLYRFLSGEGGGLVEAADVSLLRENSTDCAISIQTNRLGLVQRSDISYSSIELTGYNDAVNVWTFNEEFSKQDAIASLKQDVGMEKTGTDLYDSAVILEGETSLRDHYADEKYRAFAAVLDDAIVYADSDMYIDSPKDSVYTSLAKAEQNLSERHPFSAFLEDVQKQECIGEDRLLGLHNSHLNFRWATEGSDREESWYEQTGLIDFNKDNEENGIVVQAINPETGVVTMYDTLMTLDEGVIEHREVGRYHIQEDNLMYNLYNRATEPWKDEKIKSLDGSCASDEVKQREQE